MNRVVGILAALALMTTLAEAQRGMGAAPVFRGGPAFRSAPHFAPAPRRFVGGFPAPAGPVRRGFVPGFAFGHIGRGGVHFRTFPFCDPTFISCQFILFNSFRRHHFGPFGFGAFGSPFVFGAYGGYPLFGDYPQTDYNSVASQPAPQPIIVYAQPPQEQYVATPAPAPAASAAATPAPEPVKLSPTVLVFRDRHREEVSNYAIAGETVYVFTDQGRRKKIALSDLDLAATVKANDERGVEFRVPAHKGS